MKQIQPEYDDAYPTCAETFSTLRVFSDAIGPEEITALLQLTPSEMFRKEDIYDSGNLKRKTNGWFYSTKTMSSSKDTRRHLDLILQALGEKGEVLQELRRKGCDLDICSYWVSRGQGGPVLEPYQLAQLAALSIGLWWDIYFEDKDA